MSGKFSDFFWDGGEWHKKPSDDYAQKINENEIPTQRYAWRGRYVRQGRVATICGFLLIGLVVAGIMALLSGCSSLAPATVPAFGQERPESPEKAYCAWGLQKAQELREASGASIPDIDIHDEPCPSYPFYMGDKGWGREVHYGHYFALTKTVHVWTRDPEGHPFPEAEVHNTIQHELLHHYDWERGVFPPLGEHNEAFNRRIACWPPGAK